MPSNLPVPLHVLAASDGVYGNVEDFFSTYVETGVAAREFVTLQTQRLREIAIWAQIALDRLTRP